MSRIPSSLASLLALPSALLAVPPAAPSDLILTAPSVGRIVATWIDNASDEVSYQLQFREPPSATWLTVSTVYPPNTQTATLNAPLSFYGKTFEFRILAFNGIPESSASAIGSVTALEDVTSPEIAIIHAGRPFSYQITATNGGGSGYSSFEASPLPGGLALDGSTGLISGIPTQGGHFLVNLAARYQNGNTIPAEGVLTLRIPPVPVAPGLIEGLAPLTLSAGATPTAVALDSRFEDSDTREAVRFDTNHGTVTVSLFDRAVPTAVGNFLSYVDAGAYNDNLFHRSVNATTFDIIQSGSFAVNGAALNTRPTQPPINNAPGIANDRGTLAYARSSNPNSATSGWYFNVQDSPGLDDLNGTGGGYTVFGRATAASLPVLDRLFAFPTVATSFLVDGVSSSGPFSTVPTSDGNQPNGSNLIIVQRIVRIPALTYTLNSNSDPAVATATLMGGELTLTPLASGAADIDVTATDIDGNTTSGTIPIVVLENFTHWSSLHANGEAPGSDNEPDGATTLLEYALDGSPTISDAPSFLPTGGTADSGGNDHLTISFTHKNLANDLDYVVEKSDDLTGWSTIWETSDGFAHPNIVETVEAAGKTVVTVRDPAPIAPGSQVNLRLRIDLTIPQPN